MDVLFAKRLGEMAIVCDDKDTRLQYLERLDERGKWLTVKVVFG